MEGGIHQGDTDFDTPLAQFRQTRSVAFLLALSDVLVMLSAACVAVAIRLWLGRWLPIILGPRTLNGVFFAALLLPSGCWLAGLYPGYGLTEVDRLRKRSIVSAVIFGLMIAFDYLAQGGQWSRGVLVLAAALWFLLSLPCDRWTRRLLDRLGLWGLPVLVCGPSPRRETVIANMLRDRLQGYIPVARAGWPFDVRRADLSKVSTVIIAAPAGAISLDAILDQLPRQQIIVLPDFGSPQSQWVSAREVGAHLGLEMRRNLLIPGNLALKRAMDLVLAGVIALPALPVALLCALLIKISSPGPAFFTQEREGRGGRLFRILKIRTMHVGADRKLAKLTAQSEDLETEWQRHMKLKTDPRIIPGIGHFLRRWSLDELPQLWNVLIGDMSLSGPRPLPAYHLDAMDASANRLRRQARPGITGLCQISGRGAIPLQEQAALDSYYVRNWSLWLDIYILIRTIRVIFAGRGAY